MLAVSRNICNSYDYRPLKGTIRQDKLHNRPDIALFSYGDLFYLGGTMNENIKEIVNIIGNAELSNKCHSDCFINTDFIAI